jgi:hypothetical protein
MSLGAAVRVCVTRWLVLCSLMSPSLCAPLAQAQGADETDAEASYPAASSESQVPAQPTLQWLLQAGAGVTQRALDLTSAQGRITLGAGGFPAVDVRGSMRLALQHWFVRFRVGYQTSLGMHASEQLRIPAAGPASTAVRSHRFEGGIAPGLWLGAGPGSAALSVYMAYGLRALSTVTPLLIPRFTMHGPLLRVELEVPLVAHLLWLQIGPEAHLILSITDDLRRIGHLDGPGVAYGGEAGLHMRLGSRTALRLHYRESHAHVAGSGLRHDGFLDLERYMMLDMLLTDY